MAIFTAGILTQRIRRDGQLIFRTFHIIVRIAFYYVCVRPYRIICPSLPLSLAKLTVK